MKVCSKCNTPKDESDFYRRTDRNAAMAWCKDCLNKAVGNRSKERKAQAVEYMGGACQHCGYSRCLRALEFHHKDRTKKSPGFQHGGHRLWSWERLLKELDDCILLCANCHREEEEKISEGCSSIG